MAFQEVGAARDYKPWSQLQPGEIVVEGWYLQTYQGQYGDNYEILQENGKCFGLNRSGQTAYKIANLEPGDFIQVKFGGKIACPTGKFKGKPTNDVSVLCDPEKFRIDLFRQYQDKRNPEKPLPMKILSMLQQAGAPVPTASGVSTPEAVEEELDL